MARFLFAVSIAAMLAGMVALPADASTHTGGATRKTQLGNIVHGEDTQFIRFTERFGVNDVSDVAWPYTIAQRVINIVFSFLGIIAVMVIVYAGFLWLTAGGEEDKAKQGRTLLFQAAIGVIIVLSAWLIAYFIIDQLVKAITK